MLTLPVRSAPGRLVSPAPVSPQAEANDPVVKAVVRTADEAVRALLAAWASFAPLNTRIRQQRKAHPPVSYRVLDVAGWRFFAGGWSLGEEANRKLRVILDDGKDTLVGWDVADEASYGLEGKGTFPAGLTRLRMTIDEALPSGGRLNATYVFGLGDPHQVFQAGGLGSVARAGDLGPLVLEALQANVWADGRVKEGEIVLRGADEAVTVVAGALHDGEGMTAVRLQRAGVSIGEALPAGGGRWVLRVGNEVYAL